MKTNQPLEDIRTDRQTIQKKRGKRVPIRQSVREAFEMLRPHDRNMKSFVVSVGGSQRDWIIGAGEGIGRARSKREARMIAIVRACQDPDFSGDVPAIAFQPNSLDPNGEMDIAGDVPAIAFQPNSLEPNGEMDIADAPDGVPDLDTELDSAAGSPMHIRNLACAVWKSYGRDTLKSVCIDCKENRRTFEVRLCHEETLTIDSGW